MSLSGNSITLKDRILLSCYRSLYANKALPHSKATTGRMREGVPGVSYSWTSPLERQAKRRLVSGFLQLTHAGHVLPHPEPVDRAGTSKSYINVILFSSCNQNWMNWSFFSI
jgi:hypothetical protein